MNKIANCIASWMASNEVSSDNAEIYAYAIECLLNTILTLGLIIVIGAITGRLLITLVWMVFFLPIRHMSGGLHAPNHIGCLISSLAVGTACMFLAPLLKGQDWFIYIGTVLSIIIIFAFAPVIHSNHPMSYKKVRQMKISARVIIIIESVIVLLLHYCTKTNLAFAAILGVLSATISTGIGHFHDQ